MARQRNALGGNDLRQALHASAAPPDHAQTDRQTNRRHSLSRNVSFTYRRLKAYKWKIVAKLPLPIFRNSHTIIHMIQILLTLNDLESQARKTRS